MSLAINARFLTQNLSGVQRYADEIVTALDALLQQDRALATRLGPVTAYLPDRPHRQPGWAAITLKVLPGVSGHLWEQVTLARATRAVPLLSLGNTGPLAHPRQIVAFHDAHVWDMPTAYDWRYRVWHKALRGRLARRAREVVTVSTHSAEALSAHLQLPQSRFRIVPNAADHMLRAPCAPTIARRHGLLPGRYLLALGNASLNKNIARLIAAHDRAPGALPLVIAGGQAPGLRAHEQSGAPRRIFTGRVPDEDLAGLIGDARGFVFPSLHEGFGIPPLEAMTLGVPVAAAHRGAMPDVLGDAPIWFDPLDIDDMAQALSRLCDLRPERRADMIARGRAQAAHYSWRQSAEAIAALVLKSAA